MRLRAELALRIVGMATLAVAALHLAGAFASGANNANAPVVYRSTATAKSDDASLLSLVRLNLLSDVALRPMHVVALQVPSDTARALLFGARTMGMPVSWTDSTRGGAVAVEVRDVISPAGGVIIRVAAPEGVQVAVRDSLGLIDSLSVRKGGGTVTVGSVAGTVSATSLAARAQSNASSKPVIRRVLLLAEPGWEAKFAMAALEEKGWTVDARYAIGKNVTVTQGVPAPPDTAKHAAVIALDSSALAHVASIRRYVTSGGGVILAGAAATLREFGNLLPGRAGLHQPGIPGGLETATPLIGLALRPITADSDAVVIAESERVTGVSRVHAATLAARRFGAGRVLQVAYDASWEWRMAGPSGSVEAHRQWWGELVSAVAFAPEIVTGTRAAIRKGHINAPGNAAPYADLRANFGHPSPMPLTQARAEKGTHWELLLIAVAVLALLAEWASRRLRGAR